MARSWEITYSSSCSLMRRGEGSRSFDIGPAVVGGAERRFSSFRMELQSSTHSLQMFTCGGPAMRLGTRCRGLPQNVHFSPEPRLVMSPSSPERGP